MQNETMFTPRIAGTTQRLQMKRSDIKVVSGNIDQRGHAWRATVQIDNFKFPVRGATCGLPRCFCDAVIDPKKAKKVETK